MPHQVLADRYEKAKQCLQWVFLPSPTPYFSSFPHLLLSFCGPVPIPLTSGGSGKLCCALLICCWKELLFSRGKGAKRKHLATSRLCLYSTVMVINCFPLALPHAWAGLGALSLFWVHLRSIHFVKYLVIFTSVASSVPELIRSVVLTCTVLTA